MSDILTHEEINSYVELVRKIKTDELEKLMLTAFQQGLRLGLQKSNTA